MKNLKIFTTYAALGVMALLLFAPPANAQAALTQTTLSAAVTDTVQNYVVLASATNVAANGFIYVDNEEMAVLGSYVSGTTVPVRRGAAGFASPHLSGATASVVSPGNQARTGFIDRDLFGGCTAANQAVLPRINVLNGNVFNCFGGLWYVQTVGYPMYTISISPGAQPSATTPTAGAAVSITGQAGGAQSATTSNGAAGASETFTGGAGGLGGSSSGTGGAGGAVGLIGGAGAGTVTGGAGGATVVGAGTGGTGSSAGGTGGALTLYSGAKGAGGTGVDGAVAIKSGGASGTTVFNAPAAGPITITSIGTNKGVVLTPTGSGTIQMTGGTDPTKIVAVDASGQATGLTHTFAFADASTSKTSTFPNATGTVSLTATYACGTSAACSPTLQTGLWEFWGTVALGSASPSLAHVTALSPAYTSTTSYVCTATPVGTTAAIAAAGIAFNPVSGSAFDLTGPNTVTTVVNYHCIGN